MQVNSIFISRFFLALTALVALWHIPSVRSASNEIPTLTLVVQTSAEAQYKTSIAISHKLLKNAILSAHEQPFEQTPKLIDSWVYIRQGQADATKYAVSTMNGQLIDIERHQAIILPFPLNAQLMAIVRQARNQHYGQLTDWSVVSAALPKLTIFTIMDMETGLRFRGQRRAGSHHADVQPLTAQDTAVMKQIFGGTWSWERKAVRIEYNGQAWGGSMNGMPHGGDGIPGNDFSGHFCIHFPGSVTHGKGNLDIAHQLMAYKASGRLQELLQQLTPPQVIDAWITAYNGHDLSLMSAMSVDAHGIAAAIAGLRHADSDSGKQPRPSTNPLPSEPIIGKLRKLPSATALAEDSEVFITHFPAVLSLTSPSRTAPFQPFQFWFVRGGMPGIPAGWIISDVIAQ